MFDLNRPIKRRQIVASVPGIILAATGLAYADPAATPIMSRIKMATIGAVDPLQVAAIYEKWLGYKLREKGKISQDMAASWGAPKNAGRSYVMLSPDSNPDIFIRVVATPPVRGYTALTTAGWNGIEIIIDDIDTLYKDLKDSPFKTYAPPASPVKGYPTIFSMRVEGPAHETLYLTCETGDRSKSILALPGGPVGRPEIIWISGPDILPLRDWYAETFSMEKRAVLDKPIKGGAEGATMPNTVLLLKERSNLIQLEGNPEQFAPRPHQEAALPPGNAMASFSVDNLDMLNLPFITPPAALYGDIRAATVLDPNGNRVELIEEKR